MQQGSKPSPEYVLMGFLFQAADHGYDIHQRFTRDLGQVWRLSQSQAYAILARLETKGWVSRPPGRRERAPSRRILQLTPAGRKAFLGWLNTPSMARATTIRMEFLARVYFAQQYYPEKLLQLFTQQRAVIAAGIKRLENLVDHDSGALPFNRMSLALRIRQLELLKAWLSEVQAQVKIPREARL